MNGRMKGGIFAGIKGYAAVIAGNQINVGLCGLGLISRKAEDKWRV